MTDEYRPYKAPIRLTRTGLALILVGAVMAGGIGTAIGMSMWHEDQMAEAADEADFALTNLSDEHAAEIQTCSEAVTQFMVLAAVEAIVIDNDHQAVDDFFDRYSYRAGDSGALGAVISTSENTVREARNGLETWVCSPD